MREYVQITSLNLEYKNDYDELINRVMEECFKVENLQNSQIYVSVILTIPDEIRKINKEYRNIDKETDVLSFPMFEKNEIKDIVGEEVLGDIIISLQRVKEQAIEYGHSFERELAYMLVHGFYHLMGEDHIEEEDKVRMREKEENVLKELNITRGL